MTQLATQLSYVKVKSPSTLKCTSESALVVGMAQGEKTALPLKSAKGQKELGPVFQTAAQLKTFHGKSGEVQSLLHHHQGLENLPQYAHLTLFGVGSSQDCFPQNVLGWGGQMARALRDQKITHADILLDTLYQPASSTRTQDAPKDFAGRPHPGGIPSREEFLELFALGTYLGLYTFRRYKSQKSSHNKKSEVQEEKALQLRLVSQFIDEKKAKAIFAKAAALAESVYLTRDLQTTPGNDLYPEELARQAQQAGRKAGFKVTVWDEKKLQSEGMNGILTVGKASERPPRFIIMEYNAGKKNLPTVVFVGKGITFDTGGTCLKPGAGMEEMKFDMSGSAAVIGALYGLAQLKAPIHAYGLVATAENMIGSRAARPGDIYTAHDGQTVEVINTDAEGRLVLADALAYAKELNPSCVIDVATLTGAVVVALGNVASGVMGNNGALLDGFRRASEKVGEKVWELPLYAEYQDEMRSKCADYRNIGDRTAGSQKGGTFLNFFVKEAYPWIHLDIAGTDIPRQQGPHCPPDVGSGIATRALIEFGSNLSSYFKTK